jgi:hypothetical protein
MASNNKKRKGQNNAVAKRQLINSIADAIEKVQGDRWAASPEGKAFWAAEAQKEELAALRAQFEIGQLVWGHDILGEDAIFEEPQMVSVCSKIIEIKADSVVTEMIFLQKGTEKFDCYEDWLENHHSKGEQKEISFFGLERHIAKTSGNVWWKIKA